MSETYGLVAEFETPEAIIAATQSAYDAGYRKMEAYSPFPIEELSAIQKFETKIQYLVLGGGITGLIAGFGMQYYASVISYPLLVGGRPFNSFPSFIVVIFELTILLSAFAAVFGMLGLNGLPQPYHPVFDAPGFDRASQDRFFLCIEAKDSRFDPEKTRVFLEGLAPESVSAVDDNF